MNVPGTQRFTAWTAVAVVVAAMALSAGTARAQGVSLGLEAGWTGVENFHPVNGSFGLALFTPLEGPWTAAISYAQWTGQDGNYGDTFLDQDYTFYGNRSLTGAVLYRVAGERGASLSVGGGVGLYHMYRGPEDDREHTARIAPTATSLVRFPVSPAAAIYVRGDLGLRWAIFPTWGSARLGLEWRP